MGLYTFICGLNLKRITTIPEAFSVALDTGSSDLVIYSRGAPLKILNDSGLYANETYGDGTVDFGPVQFAEVQIGEYIIPSQGAHIGLLHIVSSH